MSLPRQQFRLRPRLRFALVALALGATATPGLAQLTRLANDEPEIRVRADGRTGVCDVLAFTADGATLLAVGEDKVLHRWAVGPTGLKYQQPLFWNTFRERRGSIYALAISGTGEHSLAAVGGFGKLTADVAVFDLKSGQLTGAVSAMKDKYRAGQAIWALAFNAAGTELAIGDDAGNVWTCPIAGGTPVPEKLVHAVQGAPTAVAERRVVWLGYRKDGSLLYAQRNGAVSVVGQAEPLFTWGMGIDKVVASANGEWLAARPFEGTSAGSAVKIRSLVNGAMKSVAFPRGEFPDRIALDRTGERLAVGLGLYAVGNGGLQRRPFAVELPGRLAVYDLAGEPKVVAAMNSETRPEQLAFHPDGKRLASADLLGRTPEGASLAHGTSLWSLDGDKLTAVGERNFGRGRSLWAVGMTADNRYLCFQEKRALDPETPNKRGSTDPKDWIAFDLEASPRGWAAEPKVPVAPIETLGGWRVETTPGKDSIWYAVDASGRKVLLTKTDPKDESANLLDPLRDDVPRCYTFLPAPGAKGTVRLAVGHAWGVSVFELAPSQAPKRIRKFAGHAGYVTAIAPAYNGAGFVTCGQDQVVAIWSLADFKSQPLLGAAFADESGRMVVKAVDPGSPASEAGLSEGDTIADFYLGTSPKPVPRDQWATAFKNPVPSIEMGWIVNRGGLKGEYPVKTGVLHRPAARFLPLRDGEWALYTYRQCYYECSLNGDRYFEWLVSKDRATLAPEVFPFDRFQKFLNKPEKVTAVVKALEREPTKPLLPDLFPPKVSIQTPAADVVELAAAAVPETVTISVSVVPSARQDGRANPVSRVELWLNNHHRVGRVTVPPSWTLFGARAPVGGLPFSLNFVVPLAALRPGPNQFEAIGIGFDAGTGHSNSVVVNLKTDRPSKRRLFGVVTGIGDYSAFQGDNDLPGARNDAVRMHRLWTEIQAASFTPDEVAKIHLFTDGQVSKRQILAAIEQAEGLVEPDDVFVLCLAGHGLLRDDLDGEESWYYAVPFLNGKPVANVNPKTLQQAFLRDQELADALAKLKCQPVVFIDCCHSGAAGRKFLTRESRNAGRSLTPNGKGPIVIAACAGSEFATETNSGGIFTENVDSILRGGFQKADRNGDSRLTVPELYVAVRLETIRVIGEINRGGGGRAEAKSQTPEITPPLADLTDFVLSTKPAPKK